MSVKQCGVCGLEFESRVLNISNGQNKGYYERTYCSRLCSRRSRITKSRLSCEWCGTEFEINHSRSEGRRFCGIGCRNSWMSVDAPTKKPGVRHKTVQGYIRVKRPDHPHCNGKEHVAEHRLVAEDELGRYLLPEEVVHHINGIKDDNRAENLMVFANNGEHYKFEMNDHANRVRIAPQRGWYCQPKPCGHCGTMFVPKASAANRPHKGKYCSRECSHAARRKRVPKVCEHCGADFEVMQYLHKQGNGRYCSNACKVHGTALLNR